MTGSHLTPVDACVFDAYGTLFDVHSAVARCREALGDKADALSALWRQKQLEYTWLRSLMGCHADFAQVTAEALDYALSTAGIDAPELRDRLLEMYLRLDAFPEVPATLTTLRSLGLKLAVLSNGSPAMLAAAVTGARIESLLDAVLSVEEVGIYKPHPSVYRLAVERLAVPAGHICFLSSNGWDVAGAAQFGFRVVWVNRYGQTRERLPSGPEAEIPDLAGLAPLLRPD